MQDILSCSFVIDPKPAKFRKTVVLISSDVIGSAFNTGEIKEIHLLHKSYQANCIL